MRDLARPVQDEEVLAQTPAAPWQLVREFCTERPHKDGWRNLLVWGDNLLALRGLLEDQKGPNLFGTRGKIKLVYIDPPFATKQDFMKDKEKAYRDKVFGAQFIEFLRRRLILLRELLAEDGSFYVHLDTKKGHYIKAVLDEVFGEENFVNEIVWKRQTAKGGAFDTLAQFGRIHEVIYFYSKADKYIWNQQFKPYSAAHLASSFKHIDEFSGKRCALRDLTAAGSRRGDSGKPIRVNGESITPPPDRHWAIGLEGDETVQEAVDRLLKAKSPFTGQESLLWDQYRRFVKQFAEYGSDASEQAQAIASRIQHVIPETFKSPWNVHYASYGPERGFSDLLFENTALFDSFVKMPNVGAYSFPYSYKPAKAGKTHTANEHFNPDFFIKVADSHDILVVEIKKDKDDSNRNRAKCRDGLRHFALLNERLVSAGELWCYHFHFLSPDDYTAFFGAVKGKHYDWRSGLMQELMK